MLITNFYCHQACFLLGAVVSLHPFYSNDLSLNPSDVNRCFAVKIFEQNKQKENEVYSFLKNIFGYRATEIIILHQSFGVNE